MRRYIFVLASFLLVACQPEASNDLKNIPNSSIKADIDSKITSDNKEVGDNTEMIPTVEKNDDIENDFDVMTGVVNKKGKCLYINDHLILIQTEHLSFSENITALYDENNQTSFRVGDTITLGGLPAHYSDLIDNDLGSATEWKNPYLFECEADKLWLTVDIVY